MSISMENLSELPDDDVPGEVVGLVRHSTDIGILDEENTGYLPSHDDAFTGEVENIVISAKFNRFQLWLVRKVR